MAEAAFMMFSVSMTASVWAMLAGFMWILTFHFAVPMMVKRNTFALMSPEAAARAATLRALREQRRPSAAARYWD